jgi:N-methylhydantoinase A
MVGITMIKTFSIGAGGGSIAWLDAAGGLHVGPRSAGADPGPACYGRGGEQATVTDADVALGYIPPGPLGGGELSISRELALAALSSLGEPLGLSALETARGVHELANATTMRALRAVSTEKGRDASEFALIAYGGLGPVHAAALASELGVRTAIVPPLAGLFSAAGLLAARPEYHDVRHCRIDARAGAVAELAGLEQEMREALSVSLPPAAVAEWRRVAELRYRGQSWSVPLDWPGPLAAGSLARLVERFEDEHERLYGTRLAPGSPVELRALRLIALGYEHDAFSLADAPLAARPAGVRLADCGAGLVEVAVLTRSELGRDELSGPLLIDEYDTTVVVPPGWSVRRESASETLLLERLA